MIRGGDRSCRVTGAADIGYRVYRRLSGKKPISMSRLREISLKKGEKKPDGLVRTEPVEYIT